MKIPLDESKLIYIQIAEARSVITGELNEVRYTTNQFARLCGINLATAAKDKSFSRRRYIVRKIIGMFVQTEREVR